MAEERISFDQRACTEQGRRQALSERLHDKIATGERSWSPERGEAVARRLGLPPFEVDADPAKFDPEREPRWTLAMTLAWIIWRTPEAVRDHWEQYRAACLKWSEPRTLLPLDGSPPRQNRQLDRLPPVSLLRMQMQAGVFPGVLSYPDAVQALIREMQDGAKLRAVGVRPNHERSEILPLEWLDLDIRDGERRNREDIYLSQKSIGDRRYTDVRIERQILAEIFSGAPTKDDALYRTGAPGRPKSSHLIEQEFERRWEAGERQNSLAAWARLLSDWLKQPPHKGKAHPMEPHSIENALRDRFNELKAQAASEGAPH